MLKLKTACKHNAQQLKAFFRLMRISPTTLSVKGLWVSL